MDENGESPGNSVIEEHFFNLSPGDLSSINTATNGSLYQEGKLSPHLVEIPMDLENIVVKDTKQELSLIQETAENRLEISDHSVPCSQPEMTLSPSSPTAGLVPTTNKNTPTEESERQRLVTVVGNILSNEEVVLLDDSSSAASGEGRSNYHFPISQEQLYAISDDESCDASFLQRISNSATAFNQQYQDKRDKGDSLTAGDSFSPEAFLSSIPLFKKRKRKKATTAHPRLSTTDSSTVSQDEQSDQCSSYSTNSHGLILPKPNYTVVLHDSSQGVPIAPRPDPNSNVPCYVLVVPVPLYYENSISQESLLQPGQIEDLQETVPLESQERMTEVEETLRGMGNANAAIETYLSDFTKRPDPSPMMPPDWTPKPLKQASRTPLPSTRVRVSPSPHKGRRNSPVITVSTTATPIHPLQGNKKQYVIVQGNNRHLKGIANYKDSVCTATVQENHQPIYLQGLPPQGFRRLWKAKENGSTERITKRSLEPFFLKTSVPASQEATVPEMDKSPLTGVRHREPCDREVPQTDTLNADRKLSAEDLVDASAASTHIEDTDRRDMAGVSGLEYDNKPALESVENDKRDTVTITPITQGKRTEDKERKKIRDRKYDAELKNAFDQLRRLVPRLQKNYSRGMILQETIKYIGILENKILDAGLWSTLQTRDPKEQEGQSKSISKQHPDDEVRTFDAKVERLPSPTPRVVPVSCDSLTNTIEETPTLVTEDAGYQTPLHDTVATLTSPIILSLMTGEDGSCTLVSPEGAVVTNDIEFEHSDGQTVLLEEVPLSIPFPQIQLLQVDTSASSELTPYSPDEALSQEPHPRLIPVTELPEFTDSSEHRELSRSEHISPQRDVFLSAMTTISNDGLNDLGVTLSPLGILLSPGGDLGEQSNITVVVEDASSVADETVVVSSGVVPDICTDMTSVAASVEITTDNRNKPSSTSNGRRGTSPGSRTAQTVPCSSPSQLSDSKPSTPRCRNRRVLQDHSNFEDVRSPVGDSLKRRRRKFKDRSPERSVQDVDENSPFAANENRTLPGRVSGVIQKDKSKTRTSLCGGDHKKRMRRI